MVTRRSGPNRIAPTAWGLSACALASVAVLPHTLPTGVGALAPATAGAQILPAARTAGRITGRVTDAATGAPIGYVQVYVVGGGLGALTRASGAFEITSVPAGTYELRAERVGLTLGSAEVNVPDDGVAEARFELTAQAIAVGEIGSDGTAVTVVPPSASAPDRFVDVPPEVPRFTPMSVHPRVVNASEVQEALASRYPTPLRNAGIGGTVDVHLFVDVSGAVQNAMVSRSSGNDRLDQEALAVVPDVRFSPALNRDQGVPVWVTLSLTFRP